MQLPNNLAFAAPALPLAARSTLLPAAAPLRRPSNLPTPPRRCSRSYIVSLGAAPPPPPPPPNDSEEGDADAAAPPDQTAPPEDAAPEEAPVPASDAAADEMTADDILSSPSFLKKKLEIVQKELLEAKAAVGEDDSALKEEKARYVRLAADFENYRRRSSEDLRQQDAKSTAKVCKEILAVLDNFERAMAAVDPASDKETAIANSYAAIYKQLQDALSKLGVEPVDAVGSLFDPEMHEAIQRMDSDDFHEDVVCQQFQRGYKIGDMLVRAAVVAVSSGPGPEGVDPPEAADSEVVADEAAEPSANTAEPPTA